MGGAERGRRPLWPAGDSRPPLAHLPSRFCLLATPPATLPTTRLCPPRSVGADRGGHCRDPQRIRRLDHAAVPGGCLLGLRRFRDPPVSNCCAAAVLHVKRNNLLRDRLRPHSSPCLVPRLPSAQDRRGDLEEHAVLGAGRTLLK